MRFFIELSYQGVNYHGWQEQPNANTVQSEINKALSTVFQEKIFVMGAGRTDSGVHAKQMFAHFDYDSNFEIQNLIFRLNKFLPEDISVYNVFKVNEQAHSRFDALSRTYMYYINFSKDPFNKNAYLFQRKLNLEAMNSACQYIIGKQDFSSFSKIHSQTFTNNCNVTFAKWELQDNGIIFTIISDRFLRNMVRAIVGTLLDVGIGKIVPEDIRSIIEKKDRSIAGASVPAHALFLIQVLYPKTIRI